MLGLSLVVLFCLTAGPAIAADNGEEAYQRGDRLVAEYFEAETREIEEETLSEIGSAEGWKTKRGLFRRRLREMLGLHPMPERTDLNATVTGVIEREDFTVEKLHFQSRPGLYVTANLYVPNGLGEEDQAPAVLYVCGHGRVKKDGISYGNKAAYQHHPAWFARNGYVCLIIDTLQLGEIEGMHHGTYDEGQWWWNARGYTPAGVEAWNCIRALDYLETRDEVDAERIGVTGRSGGGIYSWWITALDDRIRAAVPVAGITDMRNQVVDGVIEGHCDCMFMVNSYRWDFDKLAALAAPRPLLIANSDKDGIFPLDGVMRTHNGTRRIYRLLGAGDRLGLTITEGPHNDTQELRVPAFSWMNRHLKGERPLIEQPARKLFEPEQLRVFDQLPEDQINTRIAESFVPKAETPGVPESRRQWIEQRDGWRAALRRHSFRGWPEDADPLNVEPAFTAERDGVRLSTYEFTSEAPFRLRLYVMRDAGLEDPEGVVLRTLGEPGWERWMGGVRSAFAEKLDGPAITRVEPDSQRWQRLRDRIQKSNRVWVYVAPRGVGRTAWDPDERNRTHIRRRFALLGQTLDGMRVWDVRRAIRGLRSIDETRGLPLELRGRGVAAGIALYASLFEPYVDRLVLDGLPRTHREGPIFLNVLRHLDVPQAVAMAAERGPVRLRGAEPSAWAYPRRIAERLGWGETRIEIEPEPGEAE